MAQTNTDYLLQMTSAVSDRAYSAPAASDGAGKFDIHLSQAATPAENELLGQGGSRRLDAAPYDLDDQSWSARPSSSMSQDNSGSPSSESSAADQAPSAGEVSESKPPSNDDDQRETDEANDSAAAEAAGSQTVASKSTKPDSKSKTTKDSDTAAAAKAAAVVKKAKAEEGESDKAGQAGSDAAEGESLADAMSQEAEAAAQLAGDAVNDVTAASENEVESQATVANGKQSKSARGETTGGKSKKANGVNNDGEDCGDSAVVASKETTTDVAQEAVASGEVDAASVRAVATKEKAKTDDASDDAQASSQSDNRPGAPGDAAAAATKVDSAQLVGGIPAPSASDANTPSKGNDNEAAAKPVGAKSEPVGIVFARMARNNMTGASDSAAGTNDLPQVDPSRFIGRVAKAFHTAQDRGGTLQLRLSPPELGALRVELHIKDGVMSASLQTENSNARRLLLDHLPALRDRLAEQNIRVDRFDVDVRDDSAGQSGARGSQQQQFQQQSDQPTPRRTAPQQIRTREVTAPERTVRSPIVGDTGLNLII